MNDIDQWLRAITERPDDSILRRVFSDYLQEVEDSRWEEVQNAQTADEVRWAFRELPVVIERPLRPPMWNKEIHRRQMLIGPETEPVFILRNRGRTIHRVDIKLTPDRTTYINASVGIPEESLVCCDSNGSIQLIYGDSLYIPASNWLNWRGKECVKDLSVFVSARPICEVEVSVTYRKIKHPLWSVR